jgi:hypothetical protein
MAPNDTQMDVLMRRYAKGAKGTSVNTDHLDADELNAFAEGALPAATRSRYVSHLADCDDCRTVASQLALAAGPGTIPQVPASESFQKRSWWQSFGALLSMPALRYAASAMVLLAVVGIAFVVWRQNAERRDSSLVARNEPRAAQVDAASSPPATVNSQPNAFSQPTVRDTQTSVQPTPGASRDKLGESPALETPAPKAAKDAAAPAESTIIASDRALKTPPRAESTPSYAPPPPVDNYRVDSRQREQTQQQMQQTNVAGNVQHGGPRRNESNEKYKSLDDRGRTADLAKSRDEDNTRARANQPTITENKQERNAVQTRSGTGGATSLPSSPPKETSEEARKSDKTGRAQSDEITSVGGRKFRRQGNGWVDLKFKSSMSLTTVSRASGDFAALDSKLRSIAQQLGGEVIVVWKGKAYRIR